MLDGERRLLLGFFYPQAHAEKGAIQFVALQHIKNNFLIIGTLLLNFIDLFELKRIVVWSP